MSIMDPFLGLTLGLSASLSMLLVWRQRAMMLRTWNDASVFIFVIGWAMLAGQALGSLTGEVAVYETVWGQEGLLYQGLANTVMRWAAPALCLVSLVLLVRACKKRPRLAPAGLWALALWAFGALANPTSGQPILNVAMITTGVVLAAATALRPGMGAAAGAAMLGLTVAAASAVVGLVNPDFAAKTCRSDKCGPADLLFRGVAGNENALAMILAMCLPFVLLVFHGRTRALLALYLSGMVWFTGSRSSWLAVVAVLVVAALCRPRMAYGRWVGRAKPVAVLALLVALAVSVVLPWLVVEPKALSYRGQVWLTAREMIPDNPLFGHGATGWQQLVGTGQATAAAGYSAHNVWLDVAFSSGLVGVVLALGVVVFIVRDAAFWQLALPLLAFFVLGAAERSWTLTSANWMLWFLPALILFSGGQSEPPPAWLGRGRSFKRPRFCRSCLSAGG